jgi:hypothetical protein
MSRTGCSLDRVANVSFLVICCSVLVKSQVGGRETIQARLECNIETDERRNGSVVVKDRRVVVSECPILALKCSVTVCQCHIVVREYRVVLYECRKMTNA